MPFQDQYSILIHLTEGVVIIDQDCTIIFANQSFCDLSATTREKELEDALKTTLITDETISTMAGGIVHDFNNILSAILGYSELAKTHLPAEAPAQEDIDQIIAAGQRAANLMKQILDFSRKTEQKRAALQPDMIIEEALQVMRKTRPAAVEIETNIVPDCGMILADPTRNHQVTMNRCTNEFPALERDHKDRVPPEKPKQQKSLSLGTERILFVDDDPLLVQISQMILENYGYTVTGVTDSREALEKVQAAPRQFDLIVTDQTMPGLTGTELTKAVLAFAPTMPIIICSGHCEIISEEGAQAMGIKRYLHKPLEGDTLATTIRMVLDEHIHGTPTG